MNRRSRFDETTHPRVLWDSEDIARFREKAVHPLLADRIATVLRRCETYYDPEHKDYIDLSLNRTQLVGECAGAGHNWRKMSDLLTAFLVGDDSRPRGILAGFALTMAKGTDPIKATIFQSGDGCSILGGRHRYIVGQCGMLALIYDALYARFTGEERKALRDYLDNEIVAPFLEYLFNPERQLNLGLGINITWWEFYVCLWSLAAICDIGRERDRRALEICADLVRRGIHMGVDETGIIGEGPFYGSIEIFAWLMTAEVLLRAGICNLWEEEPRIREMMRARAHYVFPAVGGVADHGDAERFHNYYTTGLLLAAQRLNEPALRYVWNRLDAQTPARPCLHDPMGDLQALLWGEADQKAISPAEAGYPLALGGGLWGLNILRSGWGRDDLFFAFYAAGRDPGTFIHQHVDAGHFALAAFGEVFCAGRGYGHTDAKYHNVMMPGVAEPADSPGKVGQMWRGGRIRRFVHGKIADAVTADIAWQWSSFWYYRHALVVRFPGEYPYALILDNCNQNNDWLSYDWLFQLEADHRVDLDHARLRATVFGKQHRLELVWNHPRAEDYPRPHELELLMDRINSPYCDRKNHYLAGAAYSRMVARLHGFNGLLLTALIPRRSGTEAVGVTRISGSRQFGFELDHGSHIDSVVAAPIDRRMTIGNADGEAVLSVIRRDRSGKILYAAAIDAFALIADGRELLRRRGEPGDLFEFNSGNSDKKQGEAP